MFFDSGWRSGTWLPVHSTSSGRVLLAFMDDEQADRLLSQTPLRAVTPATVTDPAQVRRLVAKVREQGYISQRNETTPGLGAIAVPIFGPHHHAIGTLSLAFPSHLVEVSDEPVLAAALHLAARTLSQRIGCAVYPFGGAATPAKPVAATPPRPRSSGKAKTRAGTP
jgi:DNA-binding IclR family transcriptional regulator